MSIGTSAIQGNFQLEQNPKQVQVIRTAAAVISIKKGEQNVI